MGSIWDDRLAEVWAAPGKAGAGVVVGSEGVLTARHVVEGALGESGGRVLARVVRSGHPTVPWVTMRAVVDIPEWDVALLVVDDRADERDLWLTPGSPCPVVVGLGASAEPGCEATGFPEAAVQHGSAPDPSATVRQSEQVRGTVLPTGQGKSPVHPDRALPRRWMPLDVESATSGTQAGWGGMSGAGVVLPPPDGRLTGLVVAAEAGHEQRRLYVVPLADVLVDVSRLATGLTEVVRGRVRIEVRDAPRYRDVLYESCLGPDGAPQKITRETDLATFGTGIVGVKPADIADEPKYLNYVPRDADDDLRRALQEARQNRQMLLVVGESAAGKSRSTAEAMRDRLTGYRLLHPRPNTLPEAVGLSSTEPQPAVVWLDDAQHYAHTALGDSLGRLLQAGVAVVGTIRRPELDLLAPTGDLRNPAGEALNARTLVRQHPWAWSGARASNDASLTMSSTVPRATRSARGFPWERGRWLVPSWWLDWTRPAPTRLFPAAMG